jgi:hypothetical protein
MRRGPFILGLGMLLIGGYIFILSMVMIADLSFMLDWATWTVYLIVGVVLFSVGPGIMAWAFVGRRQTAYEKTQWQIVRVPQNCPECGNTIEIHSLEWVGTDEARCPFCSHSLEIIKNNF